MSFGLEDAIEEAVRAHCGQLDKAGRPYVLHPLRVMASFADADEPTQIVAVLHDVIEDTQATIEYLRGLGLAKEIAAAIDAITHRPGEPNDVYWSRVKSNPLALRVKLADIDDNTLPWRLDQCDVATAERLTTKYAAARRALRT